MDLKKPSRSGPMSQFQCQLCGLEAKNKARLLKHLKECSEQQMKVIYEVNQCHQCGSAFLTQELLLVHINACSMEQLKSLRQTEPINQVLNDNTISKSEPNNNTSNTYSNEVDGRNNKLLLAKEERDSMLRTPAEDGDGSDDEGKSLDPLEQKKLAHAGRAAHELAGGAAHAHAGGAAHAHAGRVAKNRAKSLIQAHMSYMGSDDAPDDEEPLPDDGGASGLLAERSEASQPSDQPDSDVDLHTCSYCGKIFVAARRLKRHIDAVHLRIREYKCNSCERSFTEKGGLKKHIVRWHQNQVPNITVPDHAWPLQPPSKRTKATPTPDKPAEDITTEQLLEDMMEKREAAWRDVSDQSAAAKAEKREAAWRDGSDQSAAAKAVTSRPSDQSADAAADEKKRGEWRDGIRQGTETKPHLCTLCGKCFSRVTALREHHEGFHEGHKAYRCDQCPMTFLVAPKLKRHVEAIHEKKRDHKCLECGKRFTQSWVLKNHVEAIHEKQRFECDDCEKSFTRGSALRSHIQIDHEGKPRNHFCNICGKSLGRADDFRKHLAIVHKLTQDDIDELTEKY